MTTKNIRQPNKVTKDGIIEKEPIDLTAVFVKLKRVTLEGLDYSLKDKEKKEKSKK